MSSDAISNSRAFVAVRFEPAMKDGKNDAKPPVLPRPTFTTGKPL